MRRIPILILLSLLVSLPVWGQAASFQTTVTNGQGAPLVGVSASVCQGLATTAASLTANVVTLTMASNPLTAGFTPGSQIAVYNFTGADSLFNSALSNGTLTTYTILTVTSTQLTYALIHNPATASSNGLVVQQGATSCLPLATTYLDATGSNTIVTQSYKTDGRGNFGFFGAPGIFVIQYSGSSALTSLFEVNLACVPASGLTACGASSGVGTFTTLTVTGTLNVKNLANIRFADQFAGGDCGAKIMAADSDLGTTAGAIWISQACGLTISTPVTLTANHVLLWIQGGNWTFSAPITLNFVGNSILSYVGSGSLNFTCSMAGDCLRWQINPFTVTQAGKMSGFTLTGNGSASQVGIHMGDIIGAHLDDVHITGFTGASASGLWFDNVTNFTERTLLTRIHLDGNKKDWRFTNTGGLLSNTSFGYTRALDVKMNVNVNQTGMSVEGGNIYNGTFFVTTNVSDATGTVFAISGLQYTGGPTTQMASNLYAFQAECTGCTGATFLNIPVGFVVDGTGIFINTSNTLVTNISGQFSNRLSAFPAGSPILRAFNASGAELNAYTLQINNPGANRIINLSDPGGNATFLLDIGAQNLSSKSLVNPALISTIGGNPFTFNVTNPALPRTVNVGATDPGGTVGLPFTIASGTAAMTTALIAAGACGTTVTATATNVLTTDTITASRNVAVTAANGGVLTLNWWPTANNVNFNYCNPTAAGVTPTAMTVNWSVTR
jgi:hypothetical protein